MPVPPLNIFQPAVLLSAWACSKTPSPDLFTCRPTEFLIDQTQGAEFLQPEFNKCRLYLGGDVGSDTLHLLHGIQGMQDAVQVLKGVFIGGFPTAREGLASGRYQPDQFKVLTRYAGGVHRKASHMDGNRNDSTVTVA